MKPNVADVLARKYRIALAAVVLLVLCNGLIVQPYIMRLAEGAPLVNTAGRQRMLSQRLAKTALVLEGGGGTAYLDEMRRTLGLWSAAHDQLARGDRAGAAVGRGLAGLEPSFATIQAAARRVVEAGDRAAVQAGTAVILAHEAEYLERMDRVVGLYEDEARARVESLRRISWGVTGLTLASLAALGLLILRPAVQLIRRQVSELGQARDALEARVAERTHELELARERHQALLEQFSHVGRTSALGEMASALAHEIKQPLGAVANYAEGCLLELAAQRPALDEVKFAMERLLAATLRAGRILERIRAFVTRHEPRREPFEPNQVVAEAEEILRHELRRRAIAVNLDLASDLPIVHGDPVQVQQVLVNLIGNALDAIAAAKPVVGTLLIETKPADSGGVEFRVTDNGEGIEPERLERVFEAYHSTRAGGMGMGLAISRTIIEAHQGRISVASRPGVMTTFRFTIPVGGGENDGAHGLHR